MKQLDQFHCLQLAIHDDNSQAIKTLVTTHPECVNGMGSPSSVWTAVQYRKTNALKTLLELGADPMLTYQEILPIFIAASHGYLDHIQLLSKYMPVNTIANRNGDKAIDAAILYNKIECIHYLLQQIPTVEELQSLANKYTGYYKPIILEEGRRRARLVTIRRILHNQTQTQQQTNLTLPADVHPPIGDMIPFK